MRLTHIEIENFKGIGARQSIDLKPITLLFGPNSAGKSTILQALHYLREILERRNTNPDQTVAGGLTDLGGFASFVHNQDKSLPIRLKVTMDMADEQVSEFLPLNSGTSLYDEEFRELPVRYLVGENTQFRDYAIVQEITVGIEIRWSDLLQDPYVSVVAIGMDEEAVLAIKSPPQKGYAQLTDFPFSHPLFSAFKISDDEFGGVIEEDYSTESPLEREVKHFAQRDLDLDQVKYTLAVNTPVGALPDLDREMETELRDPDSMNPELETNTPRARGLRRLLDEIALGPVRIVREYLNKLTYIGPLREIPDRNFRPRLSTDESRWAQGLAAWDLLYTDADGKLLSEANAWLSSDTRLQTGYQLERTEIREIPVPGPFHNLFNSNPTEDDLGDLQELYTTLNTRTEITLREIDKGIIVMPCDVGVGISQMIPVVVGCLRDKAGLLVIEQPELHIHPAIQVKFGDLFIHTAQSEWEYAGSEKSLLIETHSEHIILRILRRIRETTENELPPGVVGLSPDDLSVIYVDKTEQGAQLLNLRVDEEGDFINRWPKGFFDERTDELF